MSRLLPVLSAFLAVTALAFCGSPALGQSMELLQNGGFELGDINASSWNGGSVIGSGAPYVHRTSALAGPSSGLATVGDASGSYYGIIDQTAGTVAASGIYQYFTLPTYFTTVTLSFDMFVNNYAPSVVLGNGLNSSTSAPNQNARVDLLTTTAFWADYYSTNVLGNYYLGADSGANPHAYTHYSFDITSQVTHNQSYYLRFATVENQGNIILGVDNVSIYAYRSPPPVLAATKVVFKGDAAPMPDGSTSGTFGTLATPAVNGAGQIAFTASVLSSASYPNGVFRASAGTAPVCIVRENQMAPSGVGMYRILSGVSMNTSGQVAFDAFLSGISTSSGWGDGIYRTSPGSDAVTEIARAGGTLPGLYYSLYSVGYPTINDAGQVLFEASTNTDNKRGWWRSEPDGTLTPLVWGGYGTPSDTRFPYVRGTFTRKMNAAGEIAFQGSSDGYVYNLYRSGGHGKVVTLASFNQNAPDLNGINSNFTNGKFMDFAGGDQTNCPFAINDLGQIAFTATLTGTTGGTADNLGIWRSSGPGDLVQIARKGQAAPTGPRANANNGTFLNFSTAGDTNNKQQPAINNKGQVAFRATLAGTANGAADDEGIFVGTGQLPIVPIPGWRGDSLAPVAREGDTAPDGTGTLLAFGAPTLNNAGDVAFAAKIRTTTGIDEDAILVGLPNAPMRVVARKGMSLPGGGTAAVSSITFLNTPASGSSGSNSSGLNEYGQVAFYAYFDDGKSGLYLSDLAASVGLSQLNAFMPTGTATSSFGFTGAPSGCWFDPPTTSGYDFAMAEGSGSLFTAILELPDSIDADVNVYAEGQLLGAFGAGDTVDIAGILGHGISAFEIRDISPLTDPEDPSGFPIRLAFSTSTADFTMTPVPEPATLSLLALAGLSLLMRRRKARA